MIYTGYFANIHNYHGCLLSIASISPDFFEGSTMSAFAPPMKLIGAYKRGEINEFEYNDRYKKEVLDKLNKKEIHDYLIKIDKDEDVYLLCYEKEGFCHRHIVADWLENEVGLVVNEWSPSVM